MIKKQFFIALIIWGIASIANAGIIDLSPYNLLPLSFPQNSISRNVSISYDHQNIYTSDTYIFDRNYLTTAINGLNIGSANISIVARDKKEINHYSSEYGFIYLDSVGSNCSLSTTFSGEFFRKIIVGSNQYGFNVGADFLNFSYSKVLTPVSIKYVTYPYEIVEDSSFFKNDKYAVESSFNWLNHDFQVGYSLNKIKPDDKKLDYNGEDRTLYTKIKGDFYKYDYYESSHDRRIKSSPYDIEAIDILLNNNIIEHKVNLTGFGQLTPYFSYKTMEIGGFALFNEYAYSRDIISQAKGLPSYLIQQGDIDIKSIGFDYSVSKGLEFSIIYSQLLFTTVTREKVKNYLFGTTDYVSYAKESSLNNIITFATCYTKEVLKDTIFNVQLLQHVPFFSKVKDSYTSLSPIDTNTVQNQSIIYEISDGKNRGNSGKVYGGFEAQFELSLFF